MGRICMQSHPCKYFTANVISIIIILVIISIVVIIMITSSQQSKSLHHHVYDADRPVAYRCLAILHRNCHHYHNHHYHHYIIVIIIVEKIIIILYMLQTAAAACFSGFVRSLQFINQCPSAGRWSKYEANKTNKTYIEKCKMNAV